MTPPSTNPPDAAKLTLASTSPRRREIILAAVAGDVAVRAALGDEPRPAAGESPERYAVRSALAKLGDGGRAAPNEIIAAADTVVAMDGEIFGKPSDADDARTTLRRLRNRWHRVVTGVAVLDERGIAAADTETSRILTRAYSDGDIERWIALGAPFDKAGGYAIQDDRFAPVSRVDGCYLNAVGLPLCLLRTLIARLGRRLRLRPPARIPYYERCADCKLAPAPEDDA